MKDLAKIVAFVVLVLALAPLGGFWIVALVGAALLVLPISAVIAKFFPNTWHRIEGAVFDKTHLMPTP